MSYPVISLESALAAAQLRIKELTPRPVVAAVIVTQSGDYLIGQRRPDQWMGGKWCFVGGKVEFGETLEAALSREVKEELGIHITVGRLRHQQIENYEHGTFFLHYFDCQMEDNGPIQLLECSDAAIVTPEQLPRYDLLPVDIDIAKQIALEAKLQQRIKELKVCIAEAEILFCKRAALSNPGTKASAAELEWLKKLWREEAYGSKRRPDEQGTV